MLVDVNNSDKAATSMGVCQNIVTRVAGTGRRVHYAGWVARQRRDDVIVTLPPVGCQGVSARYWPVAIILNEDSISDLVEQDVTANRPIVAQRPEVRPIVAGQRRTPLRRNLETGIQRRNRTIGRQ